MSRAAVAGFALAVLPLVLTPGASFALTTQRVAAGEARAGWRVAAGTVTGIYVHAVLAALGLSALVARSTTAFTVVRLLGAGYLAGLGLVILLRTIRRSARPAPVRRRLPWAGRSTVAQALLGTVLNPKAAGVYLTLAPQFVDGRQPVLVQLVALATAHAVLCRPSTWSAGRCCWVVAAGWSPAPGCGPPSTGSPAASWWVSGCARRSVDPVAWSNLAMVLRAGLPALVLAVALAWFAYSSYRRAAIAEQRVAGLMSEIRTLEKAVAAAEQGLRTLAAHPSVPHDVALTADLTLNDIQRLTERKELDH